METRLAELGVDLNSGRPGVSPAGSGVVPLLRSDRMRRISSTAPRNVKLARDSKRRCDWMIA